MLGIDFTIVHHGCPSTLSTIKHPNVKSRILNSNILYENEVTVLMHASCEDLQELKRFLQFWENYEKITRFTIAAMSGNEVVFTISMKDYREHVTRYILENNGFFTSPVMVTEGEEHWSIVLPDEDAKKSLFKQLEEIGTVHIANITHLDHLSMAVPVEYVEFTPRQSQILKIAYMKGYYDTPKKINSRELAEILQISQSTLLEHLNKAENKIIQKIVHNI